MPTMRSSAPRSPRRDSSSPSTTPPPGSEDWLRPWAQMKYFSFNPAVYPNMIRAVSPDAGPGDLVNVYDKEGQLFGSGFFNPQAHVPLRVLQHGEAVLTEDALDARLDAALDLRLKTLRLNETTEAWRAVHSDGDGLSGLVVDRYADVLSIEVTTLGVWRRLRRWLPKLHAALGTKQHVIQVDPDIARIESMRWADVPEAETRPPQRARA
jgi:23S rRNA (cytosine1962-C5)-methyltransferase